MKLKTLSVRGIKGRGFVHEFKSINLIIGDNRIGKTARTEALKIFLYGNDPDRGERNTSVIFSGPRVDIAGTFDNGVDGFQGWTRKPKGGWTKAKDSKLPFETPPVLTNISHYLKLSASDRLTYILKKAGIKLDFADATATIKNTKVENNTAETETILDELVQDIRTLAEESEAAGTGAIGFLEAVVDKLNEKCSDAQKEVKRLSETLAGNTQQSERRQEAPVRPDIEDIVQAARTAYNELKAKKDRQIENDTDANERASLRGELAAKIYRAGDPGAEVTRLEGVIQEKAEAIKSLERELQTVDQKRQDFGAREDLRKTLSTRITEATQAEDSIKAREEQIRRLESRPNPPFDNAGTARLRDLTIERANSTTKRNAAATRIEELTKQLAALEPETCPHCKRQHSGRVDQMIRKQIQDAKDEENDATILLAESKPEFEELTARLDREIIEREAYRQSEPQIQTHKNEITRLQAIVGQLEENQKALEQNPVLQEPPSRIELSKQIEQLRTEKRPLDKELETAKKNAEDLRKWKAELEANPAIRFTDPADLVPDSVIEEKAKELETLEEDYKRHVANLADARREEETRQDLERSKTSQAIYKAAKEKFTEKREKLVEESFGPFLKIANQFTSGFMPALVYHEGELGWNEAGNFIEHSAASGIEEVLVGIGLAIALCQEAPYKVVILGKDEVARFSRENKSKLIQRMISAVGSGLVDQFFGVDTDPEPYKDFTSNPEVSVALITG